jgi:hypothetical protein
MEQTRMNLRKQIMALRIQFPDDQDMSFNCGLHRAADIAEARERELLERQAAMIAELRGLHTDTVNGLHIALWSQVQGVINKYEAKK